MNRVLISCIQAINHASNESKGGGQFTITPARIRLIRQELRLSQAAFAKTYGFAVDSVKSWEIGRRTPDRSSALLLTLISSHPELMRELISTCSLDPTDVAEIQEPVNA